MLTLLLADAELEPVPVQLSGQLQVIQSARKAGVSETKLLLDSSLHYLALRSAPEGERRGRPDIVHFFLLTALESILNKQKQLQVLVHTRHDNLIRVNPETRLIRNYNRFCGLIQQLFEKGAVGDPETLLRIEKNRTLSSIIEELKPDRGIVLHPEGKLHSPREMFVPADASKNIVAIIGGFPSGDYKSVLPNSFEKVSIHPDTLTVWTVAGELLAHYPRTGAASAR